MPNGRDVVQRIGAERPGPFVAMLKSGGSLSSGDQACVQGRPLQLSLYDGGVGGDAPREACGQEPWCTHVEGFKGQSATFDVLFAPFSSLRQL